MTILFDLSIDNSDDGKGRTDTFNGGKEIWRWESLRITGEQRYVQFQDMPGCRASDSLDDAQLPSDFETDYMRVWQRKDLARRPMVRSRTRAVLTDARSTARIDGRPANLTLFDIHNS